MPKIAIMSDIHGNAEAFQVVLDKCAELGIELFASLGDIVGYNADPQPCLNAMQQLPLVGRVRGNHDVYAGNVEKAVVGFNANARKAIEWTAEQLTEDEKKWLIEAPSRLNLTKYGMTLVHATLDSPDNWGYIFDEHHAKDNFNYQYTQVCFCGHSHVPIAFERKQVVFSGKPIEELHEWRAMSIPEVNDFSLEDSVTVKLKADCKYLFNIGSIGQPRNGDPRASFVIFDTDISAVTRYVIPYDIAAVQEKILAAGLPERLALRLEKGC